MTHELLTPQQWSKMYGFLKTQPDVYTKSEEQCRTFIEAAVWMGRSDAQWRGLPSEYGKWNTVYLRVKRWEDKGIWHRIVEHFADDAEMAHLITDDWRRRFADKT